MTTPVNRLIPCPPGFIDRVYKTIHGVEIPLRIWPAAQSATPSPWLLWAHGGGFHAGKHHVPNAWVYEAFHNRGYHIISIAYRLAPHAGLAEIMDDCCDAYKWCTTNLPSILGIDQIDLARYVVGGDSAGGTISTLLGHLLEPKPKVVIDVFGIVDMSDQHFYDIRPPFPAYTRERDEGDLVAFSKERMAGDAKVTCPWEWELEPQMSVGELQLYWGTDYVPTEADYLRMDTLFHLEPHGMMLEVLLRKEECGSDVEWRERQKKWSSLELLKDEKYPPTFILHGTGDTAVPVEQSNRFEKRLKELGIPVGRAYCEGGHHCFENKIERDGDAGWEQYIVPCMAFVDHHIAV